MYSCFSQNEEMETVGSETEAYAIADMIGVSISRLLCLLMFVVILSLMFELMFYVFRDIE